MWNEFPNSIRVFLDNKFVFQPFWSFHNGHITEQEFKHKLNEAKKNCQIGFSKQRNSQAHLHRITAFIYIT